MLRWALDDHARGPVAIRWPKTEALSGAADRGGPRRPARPRRAPTSACIGVGKLLAACEEAAALLGADGRLGERLGPPLRVTPLDPAMIDAAAGHRAGAWWPRTASSRVASARWWPRPSGRPAERPPRVLCVGVPVAYVPQGRPADILASLGLDGPGIAARVRCHRSGLPDARGARSRPASDTGPGPGSWPGFLAGAGPEFRESSRGLCYNGTASLGRPAGLRGRNPRCA